MACSMIRVAMTFFYTRDHRNHQQLLWERMPAVPSIGDTVHYNPDGEGDRAWRVLHVSWACDGSEGWHAEIGLSGEKP